MTAYIQTFLFLICSNIFMCFAWYAHLKNLNNKPLWLAIIMSWGVALFEYVFQVPGNRIGFNQASLSLAQLKIIQEVITLSVFVIFAVYYMDQRLNWNYLYAGFCLVGAVYFIFKPV